MKQSTNAATAGGQHLENLSLSRRHFRTAHENDKVSQKQLREQFHGETGRGVHPMRKLHLFKIVVVVVVSGHLMVLRSQKPRFLSSENDLRPTDRWSDITFYSDKGSVKKKCFMI